MKDELITEKTALLAKIKGFDVPVTKFYRKNGNDYYLTSKSAFMADYDEEWDWNLNNKYQTKTLPYPCSFNSKDVCSAPTQSLLQRWLRERYNIFINIDVSLSYGFGLNTSYYYIVKRKINDTDFEYHHNKHNSYEITFRDWINNKANKSHEEALEQALETALNLIKND